MTLDGAKATAIGMTSRFAADFAVFRLPGWTADEYSVRRADEIPGGAEIAETFRHQPNEDSNPHKRECPNRDRIDFKISCDCRMARTLRMKNAGDLFRNALGLPPLVTVHGSAQFAQQRTLRPEIRRWWVDEPVNWAVWLMLNPSVAAKDRNDPTALRVTHFSRTAGCDGWIGVNLYPFISSTPQAMWAWASWQASGPAYEVRDALLANLATIEAAARIAAIRMVAFGAAPIVRDEPWLEQCLEAFGQPSDRPDVDERLYCLGVNSTGQPLHPMARGRMRVPDDRQPILWSRR